jgi:hypothetical protein
MMMMIVYSLGGPTMQGSSPLMAGPPHDSVDACPPFNLVRERKLEITGMETCTHPSVGSQQHAVISVSGFEGVIRS